MGSKKKLSDIYAAQKKLQSIAQPVKLGTYRDSIGMANPAVGFGAISFTSTVDSMLKSIETQHFNNRLFDIGAFATQWPKTNDSLASTFGVLDGIKAFQRDSPISTMASILDGIKPTTNVATSLLNQVTTNSSFANSLGIIDGIKAFQRDSPISAMASILDGIKPTINITASLLDNVKIAPSGFDGLLGNYWNDLEENNILEESKVYQDLQTHYEKELDKIEFDITERTVVDEEERVGEQLIQEVRDILEEVNETTNYNSWSVRLMDKVEAFENWYLKIADARSMSKQRQRKFLTLTYASISLVATIIASVANLDWDSILEDQPNPTIELNQTIDSEATEQSLSPGKTKDNYKGRQDCYTQGSMQDQSKCK